MEKTFYGKEDDIIGNKIFEGEQLKGERNGEGKEYYDNGKLKFEGDFLNGKRVYGKGYNKNGIFELKIKNGKIKEY